MTGPPVTVLAIPPPTRIPMEFDWDSNYRQLRNLSSGYGTASQKPVIVDFRKSAERVSRVVMRNFWEFGGTGESLSTRSDRTTKAVQAYYAMESWLGEATNSGQFTRAYDIREALKTIRKITSQNVAMLTTKYGPLGALSTPVLQAMQLPPPGHGPTTSAALPVTVRPPATVPSMTVPPPGQLGIRVPVHRIDREINPTFSELAGELVHTTGVPGPPPASGLPGPSLFEAAGAQAGDLGRGWLDPPATVSGTTGAEPVAMETTVTPSLAGTSSSWLQPADPVPMPGIVPFDFGVHHAGETVQPPLFTTASGSTAPARSPGAPFLTSSWLDDDFDVERDILAARFPPLFDASQLVIDASMHAELGLGGLGELGLVEELAAGRIPFQAIDALIATYRTIDDGGSNTPHIEYLLTLKESISRALREAYPERADPQWLDLVRVWLGLGDEPVAPSAASATDWSMLEGSGIIRLLGTGEGASHLAPLPPPSAAGRAGVGAGAPPPAADQWGIRPTEMSGEPHPVTFDLWPAPPRPSSPVVYTETMRPPVLAAAGPPPGWQAVETPGFARAASGAVELPFSHREAIARRFSTNAGLLQAEVTLQSRGAGALGWPDMLRHNVLGDIYRLNDTAEVDLAAAVDMADIDWRAIEALARILHVPLSLTVTHPSVFRRGSCRHHETGAATGACPDNTMEQARAYTEARRPCHKSGVSWHHSSRLSFLDSAPNPAPNPAPNRAPNRTFVPDSVGTSGSPHG